MKVRILRLKSGLELFLRSHFFFTVTSFLFNPGNPTLINFFFFFHKGPCSSNVVGLKMSDPFGRKRTKGVFATLVSKGDWLYLRGEYKKAIESYTTVSSRLEPLITVPGLKKFITVHSLSAITLARTSDQPAGLTWSFPLRLCL